MPFSSDDNTWRGAVSVQPAGCCPCIMAAAAGAGGERVADPEPAGSPRMGAGAGNFTGRRRHDGSGHKGGHW